MPAVYAGHIQQIVWIKPKWAQQISAGKYEMVIGKNKSDGRIKCNSREDYFLSDMNYTNETNLSNKRVFTLYVCDYEEILTKKDQFLENLLSSKNLERRLILDIDLDFFSTMDPFMRMFTNSEDYEVYKSVYKMTPVFDKKDPDFDLKFETFMSAKKENMEKILDSIQRFVRDDGIEEITEATSNIKKLAEIIKTNRLDIEILHEYGSCMDDISLPDHVSTTLEISAMIEQFDVFLSKYFPSKSVRPSCLTMARSSLDDYCPPDQVDFIQAEVLQKIKNYFNNLNESCVESVSLNYL